MRLLMCILLIFIFILQSSADEIIDSNILDIESAKHDAIQEVNKTNLSNIFLISLCTPCLLSPIVLIISPILGGINQIFYNENDLDIKVEFVTFILISIISLSNMKKVSNAYMFKYTKDIDDKSDIYQNNYEKIYYEHMRDKIHNVAIFGSLTSLFIMLILLQGITF